MFLPMDPDEAAEDDSELKDVIADIDADIEKCGIEEDKKAEAVRRIHKAYMLYDKRNVFVPGTSTLLGMLLDYFSEQELFNVYNVLFRRIWPEGRQFDAMGYLPEERLVIVRVEQCKSLRMTRIDSARNLFRFHRFQAGSFQNANQLHLFVSRRLHNHCISSVRHDQ